MTMLTSVNIDNIDPTGHDHEFKSSCGNSQCFFVVVFFALIVYFKLKSEYNVVVVFIR